MDRKTNDLFSDDVGGIGGGNQSEPLDTEPAYRNSFSGAVKNYLVDTIAGLSFFTPLMAGAEYFVAGMEPEKVLKSRLTAAAYHTVMMRPFGKFRHWYAQKLGADEKSPKLKKFLIDTSANFIFQLPVYSGILWFSGASPEQFEKALPAGLAIGAAMAIPYGYFLDNWRNFCGTKSTLYK